MPLIADVSSSNYVAAAALALNSIAPQLANQNASNIASTVASNIVNFTSGKVNFTTLAADLGAAIAGSNQPDVAALAAAAKLNSILK